MKVRKIGPNDEAAYLDILSRTSEEDRYCRFFHAVNHFDHEDVRRFVEPRPDTLGFIAEDEGRPLGVAHAFATPDSAEIALVVASDVRQLGVGRALLDHVVSALQAYCCDRITAFSLDTNIAFATLAKSIGMRPSPIDRNVLQWTLETGAGPEPAPAAPAKTRIPDSENR